jgi:hypothetical protein
MEVHPVQKSPERIPGRIRSEVTLRAYEVYKHIFGGQKALITGSCRGGFSTGELIAFLYCHSFPMAEWKDRYNEAVDGMKGL